MKPLWTEAVLTSRLLGCVACAVMVACLDSGSNREAAAKAKADSESRWRREYAHILDSLSANPTYWDPVHEPDAASSMHLVTRCVNNVVYYRFWIVASPNAFARYRRTLTLIRKDEPLFTAILLDSAGFNLAAIEMPRDALGVNLSGRTVTANDRIRMTCDQYRNLASWTPKWRLAD